jgi:Fe2+ transport system protein FeoA
MLMTQIAGTGSFPLHLANENEKVRVVDVSGSKRVLRQLLAMGLLDGAEIQVLRNRPKQDLLVGDEQTRWTIGSGMAKQVLVQHLDA